MANTGGYVPRRYTFLEYCSVASDQPIHKYKKPIIVQNIDIFKFVHSVHVFYC